MDLVCMKNNLREIYQLILKVKNINAVLISNKFLSAFVNACS